MAETHASGLSWGEIKQALRLAEQGEDLNAVLDAGVRETRQEERDQQRADQQNQAAADKAGRLASRYNLTVDQVMAVLDGTCAGDWSCVQTVLKEQYGSNGPGEHGGGKK